MDVAKPHVSPNSLNQLVNRYMIKNTVKTRMTIFCSAALIALAIGAPSSAGIVFSDNFDHDNSNIVRIGWAEIKATNNDVDIAGNRLQVRKNDGTPHDQASQLALSTSGFENILLSYDWAPVGALETRDMLYVETSTGGAFTLVDSHELMGSGGVSREALRRAVSQVRVVDQIQ